MNTRRPWFSAFVPSVLVAIVSGLLCGSAPAVAAPVQSTIVVPLGGTVDGLPEGVAISGNVQIKSVMVPDPDFGSASVVLLSFDFLNVSGQGLKTGSTYTTGGDQSELIRPLKASDVIQITFPFYASSAGILSARAGLASFTLNFDVSSGKLTSGTAVAGTP